jgi:tetratricopeptide (TPR) repeat protein
MNRSFSNSLKKIGMVLALFVALIFRVTAQNLSETFDDANKLYEQGRFSEAANRYEKMIASGSTSAAVFYNLGNAYLKADEIGRAIAAYHRAENLAPRDPEIQSNLQFARNKAGGGSSVRKSLTEKITGKLTLNEWAISASIALAVWFLLLAAQQWRSNWRKSFSGILRALAILVLLLLAGLGSAIASHFNSSAVVIVPEAVVRNGPYDESPSAFTLHDGTEIEVLSRRGEWMQISDASGKIGWMPGKTVLPLNGSK